MTASRRWALVWLVVMASGPALGQEGPILPPPFERSAPVGDPPPVPGAEKSSPKEQPEALGRGPLHEGFAQPSDPSARPAPVVPKAPPEPIRESPPEEKPRGDNVVWVPGYWMWDDDRRDYLWVSGFWRVPPPGRRWTPGSWAKAEGGWRWVSGYWAAAEQSSLPYTEAPPASLEIGPNQPAPADDYQWVPGTWLPRDERWFWRPGFWVAPRPGWLFTPARYCWTPRGYLFVGGFWDRDLMTRGLPFAPVYIPPSLYASPSFVFTPTYTLSLGACLGSMWARPGWGYYAFGDFYGAGYARLGYLPWFSYGPRVRDPLWGYYRNANLARNPNWAAGLVATHQGRVDGTLPVPPRNFAGQARLTNPAAATLLPMRDYRGFSPPLATAPLEGRSTRSNLLGDVPAPVPFINARPPAAGQLPMVPSSIPRSGPTLPPPRELGRSALPPVSTPRAAPLVTPRTSLPPMRSAPLANRPVRGR